MAMPASTGSLVTSLNGMKVGDYIVCKYVASSGAVGTFSELGTSVATEIAVTGSATPSGAFYFVKLAKGLICSDRVVQFSISWDVINTGKIIQGKPTTLGTTAGVIRSLTGGVAYADANGYSSTTDQSKGAFPTNNEWDKYIVKFPSDKIQSGKTLDDVIHLSRVSNSPLTWVQDTPILTLSASTYRVCRLFDTLGVNTLTYPQSSTVSTSHGFRPVFEYIE